MEVVAGSYPVTKRVRFGLGAAALALALGGCGGAANGVGKAPTPTPSPFVSNLSPTPTLEPPATPTAFPAPAPAAKPVAKSPAPVPAPPAKAPPAPPAPAPAPAPAPEYPTAGRACEEGIAGVDELGALGTDCDTARRVAAAFDAKVLLLGEIPDEPMNVADGWTCSKAGRQMEEFVYIGCDKGDSRMLSVTFGWGA
ncbi:MAG TPA: hypothetical protein VEU28_04155 [Actinomycetota bacterium]|nr:hypothetical protein [Actinomycetota bacterium]